MSGFNATDTVLVIQMQGVGIGTDQGFYGAAIEYLYGSPGRWEFHIVRSVDAFNKQLDFKSPLGTAFDVNGNVQVVKVPFCNRGVINGVLQADAWDKAKKSGGVLAIIAGRKITLGADITMAGRGFLGGKDTTGAGICSLGSTDYDNDSYPLSDAKSGMKGEGIAIHNDVGGLLYPAHARGQAPNLTSGGGGNGKYTGGGGGANRGIGGYGGGESALCGFQHDGGFGGYKVADAYASTRIFLGAGGGASTSAAGASSVAGDGNGGGVIFIIADTIVGAGGKVIADGAKGYSGNNTGGAGGGGGGGSIIITSRYSGGTKVIYYARGARGGNNSTRDFGAGGGGGGGLFWPLYNIPSKDTAYVTGGMMGDYTGNVASINNGTTGEKRTTGTLNPNLKGFLFNSIWSSGDGLMKDTVCAMKAIPKLVGTTPMGGTAPYNYLWEISTDGGLSWSTVSSSADYLPAIQNTAGTYQYRRTITDSSIPVITDVSLNVYITVQPKILDNLISVKPAIICTNGKPDSVKQVKVPVIPVAGDLRFKWERWTVGLTDTTDLGNNDSIYIPTTKLTKDTWYRRTISSGRCVDKTAKTMVTVLPLINNNVILSANEEKCFGAAFTNLTASTTATSAPNTLSGGDGTYRYKWISSATSWNTAPGTSNLAGYNPDESTFAPAPKYIDYKRVVYSGAGDVCKDTTTIAVRLTMWALIANNNISPDTTICKNTAPQVRRGITTLSGGSGSYTYLWEQSNNSGSSWTPATGTNNAGDGRYNTGTLAGPVWYRRTVYSGALNTCVNVSSPTRVNMFKSPTGTITSVADNSICSGTDASINTSFPTGLAPFTVVFRDQVSNTNFSRNNLPATGPVTVNLTSSTPSTNYKYEILSIADSRGCLDSLKTGLADIWVYKMPVANPGLNDSICGTVFTLNATPSTSTLKYWTNIPAGVNVANVNLSNSQATIDPAAFTGWRKDFTLTWHEENTDAACFNEKNVTIRFVKPVGPVNAGPDHGTASQPFYTFDHADSLHPVVPLIGYGSWSQTIPADIEIVSKSGKYMARGLSDGENQIIWLVKNGLCQEDDTVRLYARGIEIPKGFSPNSDGINDLFVIRGLLTDPASSTIELTIINGKGSVVFTTSNAAGSEWKDWDGKDNRGEDVPEGTYYYLIRTGSKRTDDAGSLFKGYVIVKRSVQE
ncbi:MAG: gliding motility-associated C-terminal domain-containing protein [Bacteroidales bacterium]